MYEIIYTCNRCHRVAPKGYTSMLCPCGGDLRGNAPMVIGTRDSFGIGKNFYHKGKEITTWKEWENAGYRDPLSDGSIKGDLKEMVKEKKAQKREGRQDFFNKHPEIGGM